MWEVFTLGQLPYERLNNTEIVDQVTRGLRLYRPQLANEKVYSIMANCWGEVRLIPIIKNVNFLRPHLYFDLTDCFWGFFRKQMKDPHLTSWHQWSRIYCMICNRHLQDKRNL